MSDINYNSRIGNLRSRYNPDRIQLFEDRVSRETLGIVGDTQKYVRMASAKLKIVIPSDLDADIKSRATVFYRNQGFGENQLQTVHRSFPIHVSTSAEGDVLEIFDMPTTLNGIDRAIDLYFRKGHLGKSEEQQLAEEHEMANFESVLQFLVSQDAFCKSCVEIIHE